MNRRSFMAGLAGLPIVGLGARMFGLPKPTAKSRAGREAIAHPPSVSVILDGIEYALPYDGVEVVNTTGRAIPAGTILFFRAPPVPELRWPTSIATSNWPPTSRNQPWYFTEGEFNEPTENPMAGRQQSEPLGGRVSDD